MMLEIIATTVDDARRIEAGGADRIELITSLSEGGLTPSYGLIEAVVKSVAIPVNVMIRPHAKSFCYTLEELAIMEKDIAMAKKLQANGVVLGVLTTQQTICTTSLERLLSHCDGLDVTFHKAIDETNPVESIKILAKYPQITTILSSGGKGPLQNNFAVLKGMLENAGHIRLLVGGGLTLDNIRTVMQEVGAPDYHFGTAVRTGNSVIGDIDPSQLAAVVKAMQS